MKCEKCGKNVACVHVTHTINGKVSELHICEECAGTTNGLDDLSIIDEPDFLSSFFSTIVAKKITNEPICKKCGTSLRSFSSCGLLGCSNCYEQFRESLNPLIHRMHGKTAHAGKVPKGMDESLLAAKEYEQLSDLLKEAIEEERYEDAAAIRDKIKRLTDAN